MNYIQNPNFPTRYICPEKLFDFLQTNYSAHISLIGMSELGRPIFKMKLGDGIIKIAAWSQMHGNESNATLAMLDLLEMMKRNSGFESRLLGKITLDFIFMLNPDGAAKWTRLNAADIDLNRDFHKQESKELNYLLKLIESNQYEYALNLHEQRTIFSTNGIHPATLSFLAPSENFERSVTPTRKKMMAVIAQVSRKLEKVIPNQIARYSDEFYPSSVGDNFTKMGIPTILFEGGHFQNDYERIHTRKYYTFALAEALLAIAELDGSIRGWEDYFLIPENKETHVDLIYRNVALNADFDASFDIAVQYKEEVKDSSENISFTPIVVEAASTVRKNGWKEIDCYGKKFISPRKFPKIDSEVDFTFE